jgi:dihydrofolate reductase
VGGSGGQWAGCLGQGLRPRFGPFAKPMNEIPEVVFPDSLTSAGWGETTISAGDLAETRLRQERSGGHLLAHGGARFARSLVETGLIGEYRLLVHPAGLGAGEQIFPAPLTPRRWTSAGAGGLAATEGEPPGPAQQDQAHNQGDARPQRVVAGRALDMAGDEARQ